MYPTTRIRVAVSAAAGLGVLALAAACGGGASAGGTPQYGAPSGGAAAAGQGGGTTATVAMRTVNGSQVLVDSAGAALYTNDQDTGGKPKCVSSSCTAIWMPLTVSSGQQPTAGSGVTGTVGTVAIAGGKQQVTLDNKPLYTFALDGQPGQVHGNGVGDTFDGTHFTWHSATPSGTPAPASSGSGSGGGGGYNYGY